ncbi:MAG TPA: serine/threonine-protein kinase, partial [Kofleriaceae bacterium]|nr:serine/threonine-protein kinase [Kofleriaceae bacterium]
GGGVGGRGAAPATGRGGAVPEVPEVPTVPEGPQVPTVPEGPEGPEGPRAPEVLEVPSGRGGGESEAEARDAGCRHGRGPGRGEYSDVVSTTPPPRHFCPRCKHGYAESQAFCSECGPDMLRVSALDLAAAREAAGESAAGAVVIAAGRSGAGASLSAATTGTAGGNAAAAVTGGAAGRIDRRVSASNEAWLGRIVDGRYRVIELIGRGGMGVVYKVEHLRMGKIAAMKVLHRDLAEDPEVGHRFEREAAAVSRLDHPNTVHVFDFGTAGGALYLIMEYVRGADLSRLVDRDGPMPFSRAAPLLIQILGALSEAHELGIVHRDLKPENVLLTRSTGGRDYAKVLDFGLAKMVGPGAQPDVSERAQIVGTPYFMAPEQIRGDEVDPRTDVYSLGATMYRLLTGTHPYQAKTAIGVLTKHLTSELEPPSQRAPAAGLSPAIDAIVRKAMAKDPADRWPSAAAMAAALEQAYADLVGDSARLAAVRGSSGQGLRLPTADDVPASEMNLRRSDIDDYERSLRRQRLLVTGGAVVGALGVAAVAAWWTLLRVPPPRRHELEPNDTLAQATRIAADRPATGYLGRRRSPTDPDVDFFRVVRSGRGVVTVRLSAVPNLDLTLTLRDAGGHLLTATDEDGIGGGEVTHRRAIDGPLSIEVGEVMTGRWPVENVSDAYTLDVHEEKEEAGWETEPNNGTTDATALGAAAPVRGYLDARTDVDALRWDGPDGAVVVDVAAAGDLPLTWRGPDDVERPPGRASLTLHHGDLLWLRRTDRDQGKSAVTGADGVWTVTVTPAR